MKQLCVPINKGAAERLDFDKNKAGDLIEISLASSEFDDLWNSGVIGALNDKLDIFIDDFEDENICYERLAEAKDIVIEFVDENPNYSVLIKVLGMLVVAENKKNSLYFYF